MRLAVALAVLATAAGTAACSGPPSPAAADRSVCHAAFMNGGTIAPIESDSDATPALSKLVTAFNAAVSADVSAENSPGDIGGAFSAAAHGLTAYYAVTAWCTGHGYSS